MKISADYLNYMDNVEKSVVELTTGVTLSITPTKTDVVVNGATISGYTLKFLLEDTVNTYTLEYEYTKGELKQFITLLQNLQTQLQVESTKNTSSNNTGCIR